MVKQLVPNPNNQIPFSDDKGMLSPNNGLRFLQVISSTLNGKVANGAQQVQLGNLINIYSGTGSPNGVVTESPGAIYINTSGGASTTLYIKETGTNTNTGWTAK